MNRLTQLSRLGTAVWVDGLVPPVELERLVREDAVTGLTSNPTIFRAAVLGTDRYAARIAALRGRSPLERYEALAIEDVQAAAHALASVYAGSDGSEGYVSLEVAPALSDDADAMVEAARDLWTRVDRPNAAIKIPATPAGVEAVRRVTADGINVNVTLLFAVEAHAAVMDAYLAGLEDRLRAGLPVDRIASVASFFVSRVDTAVDPLLAEQGRADLLGRAAVANARIAYARARRRFGSERFAALARHGARPQRVLWASTGAKDPRYSDVKYVEELAGAGVVNTMPPATLAAFRDHGRAADALSRTEAAGAATLAAIAAAGVDLDAITSRLLDDGVAAFAASMDELLAGLTSAPAHLSLPVTTHTEERS